MFRAMFADLVETPALLKKLGVKTGVRNKWS